MLEPWQADDYSRRHLLTRSVGGARAPEVDLVTATVAAGDVVLLCNDGLTGPVDNATIATVMREEVDAVAIADRLIDLALLAGGRDNVTVVAARF